MQFLVTNDLVIYTQPVTFLIELSLTLNIVKYHF